MDKKQQSMGEQPLVSIVLVLKYGMPFLKDTLISLSQQTYGNFELVVQDGLSSDGSIEFIKKFHKIKNLSINSERDSSVGEPYENAFKRCRGDIIGIIGSDDIMYKNAIKTIVKYNV